MPGKTPVLTFVTSNSHKFAEAERILKGFGVIIRHEKLSCPEIRGEDTADIAKASAGSLRERIAPPFFVEDSGLFVKSLNGFPGAYSAWAFKKLGDRGLIRLMEGAADRSAEFRSSVALFDGKKVVVFNGAVRGAISPLPRGNGGFGYDPVFVPDGSVRAFAEMSAEEKDAFSHRRESLEKMALHMRKG